MTAVTKKTLVVLKSKTQFIQPRNHYTLINKQERERKKKNNNNKKWPAHPSGSTLSHDAEQWSPVILIRILIRNVMDACTDQFLILSI